MASRAHVSTANHRAQNVNFGSPGFYVLKLEKALGVANGQFVAFDDLIERLRTIWFDDNRQFVLERLEMHGEPNAIQQAQWNWGPPIRKLHSTAQQDTLARALAEIVRAAETLSARDRDRADRAVSRLVRLLPVETAWSIVEPWVGDRRAFRSGVVVRVLLEHGVPENLASTIVEKYRATLDFKVLGLISRNPHVAALLTEDDVLEVLSVPEFEWELEPLRTREGSVDPFILRYRNSCYWKMRAIEAFLIGGKVPSDVVAFGRPMEFVWAVGRQFHRASLPIVRRVLEQKKTDPEFVWRCMLAFNRMGDSSDIAHVHLLAKSIVDSYAAVDTA